MHRLYFAYGSNMSPGQMARRCPGSKAVGRAVLHGWRFNITKRGSASIVPAPEGAVHGVLWRVSPAHVHTLDLYEGVAVRNYVRRTVQIATPDGHYRTALTYVGTHRLTGRPRVAYMTTAVLPGARAFDLPQGYQAMLAGLLPRLRLGGTRRLYRGRKVRRRRRASFRPR
ncbi:MAG: gamma-glutamylcyclotransferase [Rhizobiales bacterium]|nr:gamma-glutamylcyclotransferase [Hyphomicrobiales bacterium]